MAQDKQLAVYEVTPPPAAQAFTPAFFVESTAPDNIDDRENAPPTPENCQPSEIDKIVQVLAKQEKPKLLITVHGFNTPRKKVLETFKESFIALNDDDELKNRGLVCIGYRWPSEAMGTPWRSGLNAAPLFLLGILFVALAAVYLVNFSFEICDWWKLTRVVVTAVTAAMAIIPLTLFGLRLIVYFRDGFRATNYGVPDLVNLIREIDDRLPKRPNDEPDDLIGRVDLSFIGHSMGGFVVTNAVRILSDVFSPEAIAAMRSKEMPGSEEERRRRELRSKIGKNFILRRLVLVSPDIPSEVLLLGRSNALHSSLIRFQEAHLFSNEGDEVLRNISTTANFFSLPTKSRSFGYRLGNVGVLTGWGLSEHLTLGNLRVGSRTLYELYAELDAVQSEESFAQRLTYFDCTDSIDAKGHGVVTDAAPGVSPNLSWLGHLRLLWIYVRGEVDVHSGYFLKPSLVRRLIYRFASIGYGDTEELYGGLAALSAECEKYQIKALKPGQRSVAAAAAEDAKAAVSS
ncbi:alpha/beta hydrolase [Methylocystis rosea]|uniref:Alpha/beta hydrolase n=1 Tax=Methylocystis rosea TaxID=173366 RepID=A0ABX6EF88_9HYPH|nr:alpha/beta hydrolase [Methylocystis rosea]QGM93359.1 alpha/beta hydrolase [Methylocystis rosea]